MRATSMKYTKTSSALPTKRKVLFIAHETELRSQFPQLIEGRFFLIECKENYELIRELTSFGKDLVVLSPSPITGMVEKRISDMNEIYSDLRK